MLTATESLAEELMRGPRELDMRTNPFIAALGRGDCPRDTIRSYAIATYVLSASFPQRLASLAAICSNPAVRLELLRNMLEEEGVHSFDGERIVRRDDRQHGEIARRFARAAGASDDDLVRARDQARHDVWLDRAIAGRRLCAALAYLTVGFEGCVPATYALIVEALQRNYGFSLDDLEFFTLHMTADGDHSRLGAAMTAALVRNEMDREEAMLGVKHAVTTWWRWHKSFVR
jgi:pyrroloquinoline-quinone synthase